MAPFLASTDGFAFRNDWPAQPVVTVGTPFGRLNLGDAQGGLCGGMVYAALDYWHAGLSPPPDRPARGEPLYDFVARRLVDSWHLPAGVAQYYFWMNLPDGDTGFTVLGDHVVLERGLAWRTIQGQLPQITADLDQGQPVPLGVVTVASARPVDLGQNHQALAYGYAREGSSCRLDVYDPNSGPSDDVWIRFDTGAPVRKTEFLHNLALSHPVRGFFRTGYSPAAPPAA